MLNRLTRFLRIALATVAVTASLGGCLNATKDDASQKNILAKNFVVQITDLTKTDSGRYRVRSVFRNGSTQTFCSPIALSDVYPVELFRVSDGARLYPDQEQEIFGNQTLDRKPDFIEIGPSKEIVFVSEFSKSDFRYFAHEDGSFGGLNNKKEILYAKAGVALYKCSSGHINYNSLAIVVESNRTKEFVFP